jgi:hypothetical protein
MTDDEIKGCLKKTYEWDITDELYKHFEGPFGRWDWCEIGDEAQRIYQLATGKKVDDYSLLNGLFNACAAQSETGTYAAVAAMLGVNAKHLGLVASYWQENKDELPKPITYRTLKRRLAKEAEDDRKHAEYVAALNKEKHNDKTENR